MSTSKVCNITGTSGGIGKACATYLGVRGFRVYGTSLRARGGIEEAEGFALVAMELPDPKSVARAIALVMEREGRIDAVVNNAGLHAVGPLECVPIADLETSWRTNCLGAILVCREVIPIMRAQGGGHIINVGSVAGLVGLPFQGSCCGSKFALEGMTEVLRAELRPFGIKVSIIEPGDIRHQDCHTEASVSPDYTGAFSRVMKVAWADEEKGYPPERIGPLVEKILASANPRLRYAFGQAFQSVVPMLRRILPSRFFEWGLGKYYRC